MSEQWFLIRDKRKMGPFSADRIRSLAATGKLLPNDEVLRTGMAAPVPATNLESLFAPPPPEPEIYKTAPQPTSAPKPGPAVPPPPPGSGPRSPPVPVVRGAPAAFVEAEKAPVEKPARVGPPFPWANAGLGAGGGVLILLLAMVLYPRGVTPPRVESPSEPLAVIPEVVAEDFLPAFSVPRVLVYEVESQRFADSNGKVSMRQDPNGDVGISYNRRLEDGKVERAILQLKRVFANNRVHFQEFKSSPYVGDDKVVEYDVATPEICFAVKPGHKVGDEWGHEVRKPERKEGVNNRVVEFGSFKSPVDGFARPSVTISQEFYTVTAEAGREVEAGLSNPKNRKQYARGTVTYAQGIGPVEQSGQDENGRPYHWKLVGIERPGN